MKVLCDMDGVVSNIMPLWLKLYNTDYNDYLKEEDVTEWGIEKFVKPECGIKVMHYLAYEGFFEKAAPYPESKEGIHTLLNMGCDIWFVTKLTNYAPNIIREKTAWVEKHHPTIGEKKVVFCQNKSTVKGDMMIDVYVENFKGFAGIRILYDRSWNRNVTDTELARGTSSICLRAKNWDSITHLVDSVLK